MADVNSPNMVLPAVQVSSTGGNTAVYESANKGGGKRRTAKRIKKRSFARNVARSVARGFANTHRNTKKVLNRLMGLVTMKKGKK